MNATIRLLQWLGISATLIGGVMAPARLRASDGFSFAPPFVEGWVVSDPAGNLSGDPNRGFMDIVETSLWDGDTEFTLEVRMAAPFPTAREMAGGKRFDVIWFVDIDRNRATGQSANGNDYNIHLVLDEAWWHYEWYKVSPVSQADGIRILPSAFSIDEVGDRARLTFPKAYLPSQSFEIWAICFSANAPSWTPLTQNPPTLRKVYDPQPAQIPVLTVDESAREVALTVFRRDPTGSATVDFATADGTAVGGSDFAATSGTLVFLAGQTNQTIKIPLLEDRPKDVTKAFTLQLSHPSEGTSLGFNGVVTVVLARRPPPTEVVAWGVRYTGSSWLPATTPSELSDVVGIAAGEQHNLGLLGDGRVVAWDVGGAGQPSTVGGLSNVVAIAAGSSTNLDLTAERRVWAWDVLGGRQPAEVKGWSNIVAIAAKGAQQLALTAAGRVVGLGGPAVPAELAAEQPGEFPFHRVVAIAAGYSHSLALTAEGEVVAWGDNTYGQASVPPGLTNVVAIAAGEYHSLALIADAGVVAWGKFYDGSNVVPMTVPGGLSHVVAISAGKSHSLALTAEGRVVGWGSYYGGSGMIPMIVPEGLSNVVSIAAGGGHSLALVSSTLGRASPVWIGPWLLAGTVDRAFHQRITVKNGSTSYTASGLPPGLVLDSATGVITGVPTQPGTYSVALSATNSVGGSTTTATLFINQPAGPVISAPGEGVVAGLGYPFRYQVVAYNDPEKFTAIGLPRGLSISEATGEITGTPVEEGDFEATLSVSNRFRTGTGHLMIRVSAVVGWPGVDATPRGASNVVSIAALGQDAGFAHGAHTLVLTEEGEPWGQTLTVDICIQVSH